MKVAVIGASGIGKQHGKWFQAAGCEVVAFAGSSKASVERTARVLEDLFGFSGEGYTEVERMLSESQPDIVAVSSPPPLHHDHALAALAHGCHLYCEKPLVWDGNKSHEDLLREAHEILAAAAETSRVFGVNTQYAAVVPDYQSLGGFSESCVSYPESFFMLMESRGGPGKQDRAFEDLWIDLAPHPISLLMKWCPEGALDERTVRFRQEPKRCSCRFDFAATDGRKTSVEIEVGSISEGTPARRFGINGRIADYQGRNDAEGVYRSYLKLEGVEVTTEDLMLRSVRAFLKAVRDCSAAPLVTGEEGLRNLDLQLHLLRLAKRAQG